MGLFSLIFLFLLPQPAKAKSFAWNQVWADVPQLVAILESVPEGRAILHKARLKDSNFAEHIKTGSASFTETTFSRTYSLIDGKEQIGLRHEITLNKNLALADAAADLAHELVHFTEKGMQDPYSPGFELSQFIRNGIEGGGGELKALAVECRLAWSLELSRPGYPQHRLCERYRLPQNVFHRDAARRDYYALGTWYSHGGAALLEAIPELSKRKVVFTSSYAGKPYPLALAEEYAMTRKTACVNNRRKYRFIASQSVPGRRPSSTALMEERKRLKEYDRLYCEPEGKNSATGEN